MFLRAKTRFKDGKPHRDFRIVENRRTRGNRVVQRQVLYLGEIGEVSWATGFFSRFRQMPRQRL